MKQSFTKFKFTNGFFYKKIEIATIESFSNKFKINIYPYFHYSGTFHIDSIEKENNSTIVYKTMKTEEENVDFELLNFHNVFYISVDKNGNKVLIFDSNLKGIMLKK